MLMPRLTIPWLMSSAIMGGLLVALLAPSSTVAAPVLSGRSPTIEYVQSALLILVGKKKWHKHKGKHRHQRRYRRLGRDAIARRWVDQGGSSQHGAAILTPRAG